MMAYCCDQSFIDLIYNTFETKFIYVFATISLANHYNTTDKRFNLTVKTQEIQPNSFFVLEIFL